MLCFAEPTLLFSLFILILTNIHKSKRGQPGVSWVGMNECVSALSQFCLCDGLLAYCDLITVTHHAYLQGVLRVLGLGITIIQYSLLWIQLTCSLRMPQKKPFDELLHPCSHQWMRHRELQTTQSNPKPTDSGPISCWYNKSALTVSCVVMAYPLSYGMLNRKVIFLCFQDEFFGC